MFNQEVKQKFIDSLNKTDVVQAKYSLGRITEMIEEPLSTDYFDLVAAGRLQEIYQCIEDNGTIISYRTYRNILHYGKLYTRWRCITDGVFINEKDHPTIANGEEYNFSLTPVLSKQLVLTENDLERVCHKLSNYRESAQLPVVYCLAWLGQTAEDIRTLKENEVYFPSDGGVMIGNHMIDDGFVAHKLREYAETNVFAGGITPLMKAGGDTFYRRLIKAGSTKNASVGTRFLANTIMEAGADIGPEVMVSIRDLNYFGAFAEIRAFTEKYGIQADVSHIVRFFGVKSTTHKNDLLHAYQCYLAAVKERGG